METLGNKIYNLRKQAGLSQEELSYKIGVSRQAVYKWENDSLKPKTDKLAALCELFNVSLDYFLSDENEEAVAIAENDKNELIEKRLSKNNKLLICLSVGIVALIILVAVLCVLVAIICVNISNLHYGCVEWDISSVWTSPNTICAIVIPFCVLIVADVFFIVLLCMKRKKFNM